MKICHVIDGLDPDAGGPPMIAARLAAGQALLGHEVTILTRVPAIDSAAEARAIARVPGMERVQRILVEPADRVDRLVGWRWAGRVEDMIRDQGFVHLHSVWETSLRVAGRLCRRHRVPYAVLLNGMLDPWSMSQSRWKKKLAMAMGYRQMLEGAAFLHLGNRDESALIKPLGLRVAERVIPNGVFFEEIEPLPARGLFYAKHPELSGRPFVLFLSRLHYKKGLDILADAFARLAAMLPEVDLVVAGPEGGAGEAFNRAIGEAGLASRVHGVGALYGDAKYEALVDASCFCLPSRQEGFSVAITEALGCGLPAVITQGCHFPEVGEAEAGRVTALDGQAVADALREVMSDEAKRDAMGRNARVLVEQRYTWPKIAAQTIDIYREWVDK